jgi:hypothetical protein
MRCRFLHRLSDLRPSTRERAKGIAQGHIVSLGIELLGGRRVPFHELTQSQMVFFNHLIEVFGVEGHVVLLVYPYFGRSRQVSNALFLIRTGNSNQHLLCDCSFQAHVARLI